MSARVLQVIETKTQRGSGRSLDDPVRIVTQYWTFDGEMLAERDEYASTPPTPAHRRPA